MKYLLSLFLLFPTLAYARCDHPGLQELSKKTGVQIHCNFSAYEYFDEYLFGQCNYLSGKDPNLNGGIESFSQALTEFVSFYPREVLDKHLTSIYLLSEFKCDKMRIGGTVSGKSIYLSSIRNPSWLREVLHHEFSSLLWRQNRKLLPKEEIQKFSGHSAYGTKDDLLYCLNNADECANGDYYNVLFEQGFLSPYGKTNYENDFNIYAEHLILYKESLTKLSKDYPLIKAKAKRFKEFYRQLGINL